MKKTISKFTLLFLTLFLLIVSCQNVFEGVSESGANEAQKTSVTNTKQKNKETGKSKASDSEKKTTPKEIKKYISLKGDISLSGAYPLSVKEKVEEKASDAEIPAEAVLDTQATEEEKARAAIPKLPESTATEYYIFASAEGKRDIEGSVNQTTKAYTLSNLELNVEWTIEAGLRYQADHTKILMKDSFKKEFTESDISATEQSFILKPNTTAGKGELHLTITIPEAVKKVTVAPVSDSSNTNATKWNNLHITPVKSGNTVTLDHTEVPSGSYSVVFTFWNNENLDIAFPVYTTVQTVNVFANMETRTWADGGNTFGAIDNTNGTFIIDETVLTKYSVTHIYVGNPGTVGEGLPGKTPSNSNGGGPYEPLETIEGALSLIKSQNIAANPYTIHISGTYTAAAAGDFLRFENSLNGKAASITLLGQTGLDNAGRPRDIINANTKGSALSINTSVPVTIKNLEIKNGSSTQGGGIYAGTGSRVTLSDGALLSSNTATGENGQGGAVYVANDAVSFSISGSAKIPYGGSIKNNDVYLSSGKTVNVAGSITSADKTRITSDVWNRNRVVLTGTAAASNVSHFQMTDPDFDLVAKDGSIVLSSPIYVAGAAGTGSSLPSGFGFGYGLSKADGGLGTKSHPYLTIDEALSEEFTDSSYTGEAVITLVGTYKGNLEISGTINAGQVIIKAPEAGPAAVTDSVTIDANDAGTALTVDTAKPVTIQNIKITGGNATNGGGIRIAGGSTVRLADGALVTGNKATKGGGVYVDSTAKLLMYGTAWIGDSSEKKATDDTLTPSGSDTGCANTANQGGGIYNDGGIVALGYDAYTDAESNSPKDFTGGVGRNYAGLLGGGIYGKFTISGGSVSYNKSYLQGGGLYIPRDVTDAKITGGSITNNSAQSDGGAAYIYTNAKLSMSGNAEISNNSAGRGGGIFTSTGTFEMSGGSFASNTATGAGGAIYQDGEFIMSGSALITPGSEDSNDVYLPSNNSFTVASTTLNGGTTVAAITLDNFRRGRQILNVSTSITLTEDQLNTIKGKIALTEDGWNKENIIFSTVYAGVKINSPIYVASTAASDSTRKVCSPGVTSGAKGTTAKPYATIAAALAASDLAVAGNKITIDGTIGKQEIAPSASLSAVTIAGYKSASDTTSSAKIDAGGTTDAGSALTVDASGKSVTISDLTITGGNATNGGGINITAGTVTLTNGANILGNQATNGGGVYLAGSGSTLYMKGTSVIGDKNEYTASGNTINLNPTSQTGSGCANKADNGGGIYCNGGNVYVGCDNSGLNTTISLATAGGLRRNYAGYGGGVYIANGTFMTASGQISYNWASSGAGVYIADGADHKIAGTVAIKNNKAGNEGGGLYIGSGSTVSMSGSAKIEKNNAVSGGGASLFGTLNMSAGTIGGDSPDFGNTASSGGGVNIGVENSSPYPCGTFNMSGGTISYNSCGNNGGGVSIGSRTPSSTTYNGTFSMSGGIISNNTARSKGGAVLQFGKFNISGSASIPYGVTSDGTTTKSPGYNDVYLFKDTNTITVASSSLSGGTSVATVTPTAWKRGTNIIEWGVSATDPQKTTIKGQIKLSKDDGGWNREEKTVSGKNYVCINSPIYVAGSTGRVICSAPPASGNNGTISSPYATIAAALGCTELSAAGNLITIDGTIGKQEIAPSASLSAVTIAGYKSASDTTSSAKIDAGGTTGAGSALTVNKSGLTVTITDLTITGGTGTEVSSTLYGGGIYINAGNVQLTNGAVVNGNSAAIGGGVYLNAGNLYINGSAVVGKPGVNECAQNVSGKYGNMATLSGGGIGVQNGTLWLGYTPPAGSSTTPAAATTSGGVLYNLVCSGGERHGGGIDNNSGTLNIAHGYVSYNYACSTGTGDNDIGCGGGISTAYVMKLSGDAEISHNKSANGGGVYITRDSTNGSFTMEGGKVTLNESEAQHGQYGYGGGVAIGASGSFTLAGGEVSSNEAEVYGGAVWHNGAGFEIKGTATKIPAGTNNSNNIAFYSSSKRIKVTGSTSHGNGEIAVTPASWSRGSQIFEDGSTTTYFSKFKLTDPEWSIVAFNDGSKTTGRIDADIYVAPTSSTTTVNSVTYGKGAEATAGGLGTKAKPYSTIADAVAQCWGGPNDTGTGVSRTINIVGTITGAQEITSAVNASGITLKGVNTSATLNGGMSSTSATKKPTLTISTVVPVTIQTLTVKGGYSSDNGGGILVDGVGGASLTLGENAKVSGNTATANGGGIYFKGTNAPGGTGSLIMNSTSAVSGNTATETSSKGGGIYLQYASLYMSGSALIGDTAGTIAATSADGGHSNMANSGGGVYCDTSANIKLGYASASDASGTDLSETYGIRHNYATRFGGGVYMAAGSLTLKTGKIFANGTSATSGNNGGGVYVSNVASFTMYGGTVAKNKAYNGGGVCIDGNSSAGGTFTMSGGTIGDSSSGVTSAATTTGNAYSNYAANLGGGLYAGTKTSVTLNGGYISYNYSVENGGGIYTNSDTTFKANAKYNTSAASGGGIYSYGSSNTLTMSGGTIYGNKATGTSTDTDNQKFLGGGGVWFDGTFKMSGGTIQGNSATWYGGGVATYEGYFYMSGSAVIGDKSKAALPDESATTSPTANRAKYGGGFAATNDADVYLGYSGKTGTTLNASSLADGGIYYNYASEHGGGYYQIGGRKLIMSTGNISYNKAAALASKGGGIYIDSGLQMSGGTITGNYAENGGAVYLNNCVYEASGSIYIPYSSASGSVNKENVVAMNGTSSKITVTDSLTNTNSKVMTVEPRAWAIGTLVADKNTSISLDNFKTSVGKIGMVKNGLYSKVELSTSQGSTTGVVGVDMNNITETDVKNYISGKNLSAESSGKWAKEGLSYFVVQYVGSGAKNGKVGIVRVHDNRDSTSPATKGKVLANGIGFLSSPNAVSTTEKTYNISTPTWFNEGLDIFNTGSSSWWDGDQVGVAHSTTSGELLVYYWEKVKGIRMD